MEEMSKLQQGYSIPDDDVRQALISENIELILPKYKIFYSKWVLIGTILTYFAFRLASDN
jgi:Exo70 exocyst complex subunit